MADASRSPNPPDWGDVFAALPLEAPPASRWPQIEAQLGAAQPGVRHNTQRAARTKTRPRSNTAWWALAASLLVMAALPLAWTLRSSGDRVAGGVPQVATVPAQTRVEVRADPRTRPHSSLHSPAPSPAPSPARTPVSTLAATDPTASSATSIPQARQRNTHRLATAQRARHRDAAPEQSRTDATTSASAAIATATDNTAGNASDTTADGTLESLYAASAQLETLLVLTRDTRAETGPAATLTGGFDAEIATIDAQLAQRGLPVAQQQALWRARVETLQQATTFEVNQRWLSAHGRRYEGALVRVD